MFGLESVIGLPGIRLGRFATWTGEDLVQFGQNALIKTYFGGAYGALQLLHRARTNDRRADDGIMQQPSQGNFARRVPYFAAKAFIGFELLAFRFYTCDQIGIAASSRIDLFKRAS